MISSQLELAIRQECRRNPPVEIATEIGKILKQELEESGKTIMIYLVDIDCPVFDHI